MSQEKIERWSDIAGNDAPTDKLTAFLESMTDSYAILQLRRIEDTEFERFMSLSYLHRAGKEPEFDHYEVVYTADLPSYTNRAMKLEGLYTKFNIDRPSDFTGHSLSVSDIVALKNNGAVSFHYVDSIGFKELRDFMKSENYLKSAEMSMEDDYGMIDGIINNGRKDIEPARPSVLEQLKDAETTPSPKISAKSKDERDI